MRKANPEGPEHRRLRRLLEQYAHDMGFTVDDHPRLDAFCKATDARECPRPDVMRTRPRARALFMGEAKDATTKGQGINGKGIVEQVEGYIEDFGNLLDEGVIDQGLIAFATNDADEAAYWSLALDSAARAESLTTGEDEEPDFVVEPLGKDAWVVIW